MFGAHQQAPAEGRRQPGLPTSIRSRAATVRERFPRLRNLAEYSAASGDVLLSIPFVARRDDFLCAMPSLWRAAMWGRLAGVPSGSGGLVIRLPAARKMPAGKPSLFAARHYAGQVVNLRPIVNRPAGGNHNAGDTPAPFAASRYAGQDVILRADCQSAPWRPAYKLPEAGCRPAAGYQPAPHSCAPQAWHRENRRGTRRREWIVVQTRGQPSPYYARLNKSRIPETGSARGGNLS